MIIAAGILLSSIILIDVMLPKEVVNTRVLGVVLVRTNNKGINTITRADVVLNNSIRFPISKDSPNIFEAGESVEVGVSRIFKKPSYLKNLNTGISRTPIEGLFSYFLLAPIALAVSSGLGVYFKNSPKAFNNCCVFTLFLLIGSLIILIVV